MAIRRSAESGISIARSYHLRKAIPKLPEVSASCALVVRLREWVFGACPRRRTAVTFASLRTVGNLIGAFGFRPRMEFTKLQTYSLFYYFDLRVPMHKL
ncbi:MAG: hypothetical protein QOK48_910 [Blastocatellia bacterium]|nr:hypothetical protein [Blastocatellia bacterium]